MEIDRGAFELYLGLLGDRDTYCIFGGRQEWDENSKKYHLPATSPLKKTEWVSKEELERALQLYVDRNWTVWVSLNDKEIGVDKIEGVNRIRVIWFDFDAPRVDKSKPATDNERADALSRAKKMREFLSGFNFRGFIACSGNGYHLFYPVDFNLPGVEFRKEFNQKLKRVYQRIKEKTGIEFDTTTDIRRVTQPIGFLNLKIPGVPLKTYWVDSFTREDIERARKANFALVEQILNAKLEEESPKIEVKTEHPAFEELLKANKKVRDLYAGYWGKYAYKSRSEAEQALITILFAEGFSEAEIKEVMEGCKIGKWQEEAESYRALTLKKGKQYADKWLEERKEKEEEKKAKKGRGRPERVNIGAIIGDLIDRFRFVTAIDTEDVYVYRDGIYEEGEALIKSETEKIVGDEASSYLVSEIIGHIQRRTYVSRSKFNEDRSRLPVKNGLINLNTFELEQFDPSKIYTYKLPVEYKNGKDCPAIKKFISEVIHEDDIPTLQEFLGYMLYPNMPAHKSLWLYGTGRNGKSTLLKLVRALLGGRNIVSVPFEALDGYQRFSKARLYGKLLNVISEPVTIKRVNTPEFKSLIGGDLISAEVKNKQKTIDFENFAKFVILGNRFPMIDDETLAFWDRLIVIDFPNIFTDSAIPDLAGKLIENKDELSGFLNWCLEGLRRLVENNFHFTVSKTSEQMKLEFEKVSNSARAFVSEECIKDSDSIIPKHILYEDYKRYCDRNNLTVLQKVSLTRVVAEIPGIKETKDLWGGKVQHCWRGIISIEMKIEREIYSLVDTISEQDNRGVLVDAIVGRLKSYDEERVRQKIDEMVKEGGLVINVHDETGIYVVRG
jgi:putative DNA primase/helicase